jgi:hypothetical protein
MSKGRSNSNKKFFQTEEFKLMSQEWKLKLEASGFNDIEWESQVKAGIAQKEYFDANPQKIQYFDLCLNYLNSGDLTDPLDILVLELHCEGLSNRSISKWLYQNGHLSVTARTIDRWLVRILLDAQIEPIVFR